MFKSCNDYYNFLYVLSFCFLVANYWRVLDQRMASGPAPLTRWLSGHPQRFQNQSPPRCVLSLFFPLPWVLRRLGSGSPPLRRNRPLNRRRDGPNDRLFSLEGRRPFSASLTQWSALTPASFGSRFNALRKSRVYHFLCHLAFRNFWLAFSFDLVEGSHWELRHDVPLALAPPSNSPPRLLGSFLLGEVYYPVNCSLLPLVKRLHVKLSFQFVRLGPF